MQRDGSTARRRAIYVERSANLNGTFSHPLKPKVSSFWQCRVSGLEPGAVVGDGQYELVWMIAQVEFGAARFGMADNIGNGLLGNAQYFIFNGGRESPICPTNLRVDCNVAGGTPFSELCEPIGKGRLCVARPEVPYAAPRIGESLPYEFSRAIHLLACLLDKRLREQMRGQFELGRDADEPLCQRIVNLARDPTALCKNRIEFRTKNANTYSVRRKG